MRELALLSLALIAGCGRCRGGEGGASIPSGGDDSGFEHVTLEVSGRTRDYLLHVPQSGRGPLPLVVSLHGGGGKADGVEKQSGWRVLGDREGFVVAYPTGLGKSWNDGRKDTPSQAIREDVDDVGFLAALIDDVGKRTSIDKKRVFMNGISNGAFMSSRFACERADLVAAIGLVAATMGPEVLATCKPTRRMSVIAFSGTTDPIVTFEGGTVHIGRAVRGKAVSFSESLLFWTTAAQCEAPEKRDVPDIDRDDDSSVHLDAYRCERGSAVHAYTIIGGGHTWPGGHQYLPKAIVGHVNRDIDATSTMWAFFAAHPITE